MRRKLAPILLVITVLLLCLALVAAEAPPIVTIPGGGNTKVHRIVAVGDIHGDPERFRQILLHAQVVREVPKKDGGELLGLEFFTVKCGSHTPHKTTIVQMGDLVDRGEDDREAMDIAFGLFEKAAADNTTHSVVLMLGNHELMNLQKDYRYVHSLEFGGFVTKRLRDMAFDIAGPYGKFITDNLKTIHIEQGTLFVHAGIVSDHLKDFNGVDAFNDKIREDLRLRNFNSPQLASYGPIWSRKTVFSGMADDCGDIEKVLRTLGVDRIVVGHTVERSGRFGEYCDGKLFTIDIGLSRWMYNRFAALEIIISEHTDSKSQIVRTDTTLWELSKEGRKQIWPPKDSVKIHDDTDLTDL